MKTQQVLSHPRPQNMKVDRENHFICLVGKSGHIQSRQPHLILACLYFLQRSIPAKNSRKYVHDIHPYSKLQNLIWGQYRMLQNVWRNCVWAILNQPCHIPSPKLRTSPSPRSKIRTSKPSAPRHGAPAGWQWCDGPQNKSPPVPRILLGMILRES